MTSDDTRAVTARFIIAKNEVIALAESFVTHGWLKVPDTQNAGWTNVNNIGYTYRFAMMFGGAPIAAVPFSAITSAPEPVRKVWDNVDDAQTTVWTDIPDKQ